ncbi:hypothetical protein BBP40_000234 [Aspergillus hancockii]|nr:hypothetical protein BBP40_000234 [Aspergillus hancockii]
MSRQVTLIRQRGIKDLKREGTILVEMQPHSVQSFCEKYAQYGAWDPTFLLRKPFVNLRLLLLDRPILPMPKSTLFNLIKVILIVIIHLVVKRNAYNIGNGKSTSEGELYAHTVAS